MATWTDVADLVRARLALWPHDDVPLWFENDHHTLPDEPAPYIEVKLIGFPEIRAGWGGGDRQNNWLNQGGVILQVFVPRGDGTAQANALLEEALALFRDVQDGPIQYHAAPFLGLGSAADDGNYWQQPGRVNFTFRRTA